MQADLARLRVLVVGAGSVGQLVLEALARTGIQQIGVMDFDTVETINLDRLHGATPLEARLSVSKVELAHRLITQAATAEEFTDSRYEASVCEPDGLRVALDYDVVFSCVDRPWARHVLNTIAFADLIPVIDGGIRLEPNPAGGLRNAYWRSHVAAPGRTCIRCLDQYNVADVQLERDGSLDDSSYIAGLPADSPLRVRQNVYAISMATASALVNQFLSLVVAPSGFGDPGARRFDLRQHRVDPSGEQCQMDCSFQRSIAIGDERLDPTGTHEKARQTITSRRHARKRPHVRAAWVAERMGRGISQVLERLLVR